MKPLLEGRYEIAGILEIDSVALSKICNLCNDIGIDGYSFRHNVLSEVGTNWIGKRGSWPKRVARRMKTLGMEINNDNLSRMGKIARESCITGDDFILYVKRRIDWSAGDYNDDGSCYWNSKSDAKRMVVDAGGGALCLHHFNSHYNEEEKIARCWWVPWEDHIILFNGYTVKGDDMSLTSFSRMIMDLTERTYYRKIGLDNRGISDGLLWINSAMGFIVGDSSVQDTCHVSLDILPYCADCGERFTDRENIVDYRSYCDSCYNEEDEDSERCCYCGDGIPDGDEYYVGDNYYCSRCYHRLFRYCDRCETDVPLGDCTEINGEWVCYNCLRETHVQCSECDEWIHKDVAITDTPNGDEMCNVCYSRYVKQCDICGEYHWEEDVKYIWGMNRCYKCLRDKFVQCDCCFEWVSKNEIFTMVDGWRYCEYCVTRKEEVA